MKLKNIPNKESYENYTFRLRESDAKVLEQYRSFAGEKYETEFTMPELLNSVITSAMEDDKEFQAWLKKGAKTKARADAKAEAKADGGKTASTPAASQPASGSFGGRAF